MRHHYTYAVSYNDKYVLVQIQGAVGVLVQMQVAVDNTIEQVRIPLTVEETEHMITLLQKAIKEYKEQKL